MPRHPGSLSKPHLPPHLESLSEAPGPTWPLSETAEHGLAAQPARVRWLCGVWAPLLTATGARAQALRDTTPPQPLRVRPCLLPSPPRPCKAPELERVTVPWGPAGGRGVPGRLAIQRVLLGPRNPSLWGPVSNRPRPGAGRGRRGLRPTGHVSPCAVGLTAGASLDLRVMRGVRDTTARPPASGKLLRSQPLPEADLWQSPFATAPQKYQLHPLHLRPPSASLPRGQTHLPSPTTKPICRVCKLRLS